MRYRRPGDLVCYWRAGHFLLHRFDSGEMAGGSAAAIEILTFFDDWQTAGEFARAHPDWRTDQVRSALASLAAAGFLEARRARTGPRRPRAGAGWTAWNPAAGFFHFSTRDVHAATDDGDLAVEINWRRLAGTTRPPLFKRVRGPRTRLPAPRLEGELADALRARRTWRRFGDQRISSADLSTLLSLTFGVQHLAVNAQGVPFALRSSPSGGALQATEAYVVARAIDGVPAGVYHYQPLDHTLERVRGPVPARRLTRYVAGQSWFAGASALIVMSAMFARAQWKYESPRAYRTVLTEVGHFGQTFCLVATQLGLAPFCTQAFADSLIEADLGIDGRDESLVYVAGVGTRPAHEGAPDPLQPGHPAARRP